MLCLSWVYVQWCTFPGAENLDDQLACNCKQKTEELAEAMLVAHCSPVMCKISLETAQPRY